MLGFDVSFKALADPSRRAILKLLRDGPRNAGDIGKALDIPATALSFHLRTLKQADLVADQRRGQFIEYRLNASVVDELIAFAIEHFAPRRGEPPDNGTQTSDAGPNKAAPTDESSKSPLSEEQRS